MTAAIASGTPARVWSPMQVAIFNAVDTLQPGKHVVVEALAGTGKTSTIVEALNYVSRDESVLLCAFNKAIATELQARVPHGVQVMTLHSLGLKTITRSLGRLQIDADLVKGQLRELLPDWHAREARTAIAKLVGVAKGSLAESPAQLDALADAFQIEIPEGWDRAKIIRVAAELLASGREPSGRIDFDDMIWLPIARDLRLPAFDWVFVDETQDLNPAQLEMVVRAAGSKGSIVAIGDRRQSIYGFRGADRDAIPRMIRRLDATVLPLSVTYRCPSRVVREAQALVPALEAAPGAPEGIVRSAAVQDLERDARAGDYVISRSNAPLLALCWRWIRAGVKAEVKGRDIGAGLVTWIKGTNATTIERLTTCAQAWYSTECKRLTELDRDLTAASDKYECILSLCEGCSTVDSVIAKIGRIFGEGSGGGILLMSTHRSKGLEADRVWLLRDTYLKWSQTEEEKNLLYVGITRAKKELVYVHEKEES